MCNVQALSIYISVCNDRHYQLARARGYETRVMTAPLRRRGRCETPSPRHRFRLTRETVTEKREPEFTAEAGLSPRFSRERACSVTVLSRPVSAHSCARVYVGRVCAVHSCETARTHEWARSSVRPRRFINGPQSSELHQFLPRTLLFRARA